MKIYKMIITSKESNNILHIKEGIKEFKITDYIDWFYSNNLQSYANYKFEEVKER